MKKINDIKEKLEITYPCDWSYKVIGLSEDLVKKAISKIFGKTPLTINKSNQSKTGKYVSFNVNTTLQSAEEKDSLFNKLNDHKDIKFVL
ncbi:MAG TPA: DUF493 domain-containing protein [Victivallales bacterium]|nr:DUF493 domain-containing protein [Victivallales bacterium]